MTLSPSPSVASTGAFGWKASPEYGQTPHWEGIVIVSQVSQYQSRMVLSKDFEATNRPSAEKETLSTLSVCSSRTVVCCPMLAFQSRIVLSVDAEASVCPSGDHAT